jgi:hypothetical protein
MATVGKLVSGTIHNYLYGVIHQANQATSTVNHYVYSQFPQMNKVMDGIKKTDNHMVQARLPLTIPLLSSMITHLRSNNLHDAMIIAALTTGVHGLLRAGEMATDKFNHICPLLQKDMTMYHTHYDILLRASKTDRFGAGVTIRLYATGGSTCPVRAMTAYVKMIPPHMKHNNMPLFITSSGQALTKVLLVSTIKSLVEKTGQNASLYTGHSMRRGGATSLALAGIAPSIIKQRGRWKSHTWERYVNIDDNHIRQAAMKIGSHDQSRFGGLSNQQIQQVLLSIDYQE